MFRNPEDDDETDFPSIETTIRPAQNKFDENGLRIIRHSKGECFHKS